MANRQLYYKTVGYNHPESYKDVPSAFFGIIDPIPKTRCNHPVLPSSFEKQSMIGCKIYISKMVNTFDSQYFIIEWRRSMQLFSILIMAKMYVMALCEKSSPGAIVD